MTKPTVVGGIGQIHVGAQDIRRAVAFYRDVLGLPLLFEVPDQNMAFFDCGGVRLYLSEDASEAFPSHPLIYYHTPDINAACAAIAAHGVSFEREPHVVHRTPEMELWMAGFRDSEGNFIHLMSEVALSA
ncbi:MAG: glyoxalase/bleomycin resistance/dioxygenase family protein [Xanthomonadales bacterium]|nr:glyoxalase/bleomycin resistance/dioxygenase family protein [Xanthomonadales bacterium]NIN59037.1 glyoxalase/bleomycin resistance/dioxygenase family protein [Xanthomonadales bacterium]NIN74483.1 glyoxalase/bleomycin resistance/dioxygenase family protein [Xanthomonadales bacterium]NIO14805.1 glyoxalase/bleomycin resistance/dioxygenase family protein [Xanthomonadales bacterium]NIP11430.1 glyoxalase/bleomycin resistance/dioxygenase family protein [Xanthomonadales bacterium]